jgi:hypothetical protein
MFLGLRVDLWFVVTDWRDRVGRITPAAAIRAETRRSATIMARRNPEWVYLAIYK